MTLPTDQLVTIAQLASPFEADALAAALEAQGIEALAVHANTIEAGLPLSKNHPAIVVVHEDDRDRALEALKDIRSASTEIDWDDVDTGERVDDLPLHKPGRMPLPAKIAFAVALGVVALTLIVVIINLIVV